MSQEDQLVLASVESLAHFYVGDLSLQDTLQQVLLLAEKALPQSEMIGITMMVDGKPNTAVFTSEEAPEIDVSQYQVDEGPCLEAFRTKKPVVIESTELDDRFISFCTSAREHGIQSTLSLPLIACDAGIGALNIYSRSVAAFSEIDKEIGERFASHASIALANSQAYWDARGLSEHLTQAMVSRATIEQAKGILMAQSGVDADAAFELLRSASQRENRKVRDVAEEIVMRAAARPSSAD